MVAVALSVRGPVRSPGAGRRRVEEKGPVGRHHRAALFVASVVLIAALGAGGASAATTPHRLSPHRRAAVRASLLRAVKRHPGIVGTRAFVRRASLVNFKLPITVRLRQGPNPATTNLNRATVDLGASLGQREVALGGYLPGELTFHDSFDGGALRRIQSAPFPRRHLVPHPLPPP